MPPVYQGKCSNCGYETPVVPAGYVGVLLDAPIAETWYRHPDDDCVAILGHPAESDILEELGYTQRSTVLEGRSLWFANRFCTSCGHLYQVRDLNVSASLVGCLPVVVLGVAIGIAVGIWRESTLSGLVGAAFAVLLGFFLNQYAGIARMRSRHAQRARELQTEQRCPKCGSEDAVSPHSECSSLPCPECKEPSVQLGVAGFS
jgi:predicted Zn-ribbon and HTH transcriptional regulator